MTTGVHQMTDDRIAPCPACNDDDNEEGAIFGHDMGMSRLECDCGYCGPWCLMMSEARDEWNRLAKTVTETARLRKALGRAREWASADGTVSLVSMLDRVLAGGPVDLPTGKGS